MWFMDMAVFAGLIVIFLCTFDLAFLDRRSAQDIVISMR